MSDAPPSETGGDDAGQGADAGATAAPRYDQAQRDGDFHQRNGRRHRRHRGRGRRPNEASGPPAPVVPDAETIGWFGPSRDGGFIRRAANSYLAEPSDAWIPPHVVRQFALRQGDLVFASTGHDHRGRNVVCDIRTINDSEPAALGRRPDFSSLTATYPERRLTMETGRPAKAGPELTRRCIDLMAPIGYGQRALIVAPARAGKTMLLHAITEGIAINHPNATLLILLVDERPEEVSEAISWGVGEVVASSFDQPANRHVEVCEMVLERARRLVEMGKDVVIVLDSLTRMARAHNTAERGSGRTLSGRSRFHRDGQAEGVLRIRARGAPQGRRWQPHHHRDRARRDGIAHGRRDLRGVQGHGQLRDQARSFARRKAHLPGIRHRHLRARAARRSSTGPSSSTRFTRCAAACSRCHRRRRWSG